MGHEGSEFLGLVVGTSSRLAGLSKWWTAGLMMASCSVLYPGLIYKSWNISRCFPHAGGVNPTPPNTSKHTLNPLPT